MKILLVEDDRDMSKALSRALEKRGFGVSPCYDGISAYQAMRQEAHDLVILDLNIPGEDGLHLLQRVRNAGIHTPVLVLTARSSVGDRIAGLKPLDTGTQRGDPPGRLVAIDRGQTAGPQPVEIAEIGMTDGDRLDRDPHLARTRRAQDHLLERQGLA